MRMSRVSCLVQPSPTRRLFNMAREYGDVIDFTLGDPDLPPHPAIRRAACEAIEAGRTRYSQNAGLPELREAISQYCEREEGLRYDPQTEIIATVGAMEGLYLTLLSLLDEGDEVIIPAPYYVNYVQMVLLCHAVPVVVGGTPDDPLAVSAEAVERAVTPRTRAIIINTPANPTGRVTPRATLAAIAATARRHDLTVIADEVYKCLVFDRRPFASIVGEEAMRERTVLVNSLSKEFCMTGWRIGYVLAPAELVATMTKLQENVCACAPLPSQHAATRALRGGREYSRDMVAVFTRRRDCLTAGIQAIPGLRCQAPEATFYLMADISATGLGSEDFALRLLQAQHVAVVPGIAYGEQCEGHVRLAFTLGEEKIREGVRRIAEFMKGLGK